MADSGKTIEIFGSLRSTWAGGKSRGAKGDRGKAFISFEVQSPELNIRLDKDELSQEVCKEIATTIELNARHGKDPSGRPLPRISASTEERREYRAQQAARDGHAHDRGMLETLETVTRVNKKGKTTTREKRGKVESTAFPNARKNYRKRFWAPRVRGAEMFGGVHRPSASNIPHGRFSIESMLLWRSAVVARVAAGQWGVYFANARALFDEKGSSAIGRVSKRIRWWSQEAMRQPNIQATLQKYLKDAIKRTRTAEVLDLARELAQTAKRSANIIKQVERP